MDRGAESTNRGTTCRWIRQPCHALERRTKALPVVSHRQEQAYHVERRYIALIREEAEAEGVSIVEVVNRALGAYFEKSP